MPRRPEAPPAPRRRRWRRRLTVLAAILALAYGALWTVRLTRSYGQVPARPFLLGGPLVFAHRGASAELAPRTPRDIPSRWSPEHSLAAYRRALDAGADVLEVDVHRARDGALVVSHDRDLARAFGVAMAIAEHDLPALRAAVAAAHPGVDAAALLPTLDEILTRFSTARLNLELKADSAALAADVAALLARARREDDVLVASFHGDALEAFRRASGGRVATSASPGEVARFLVCYVLDVPSRPDYEALQLPLAVRRGWPRFRLDRPSLIEFAHRHGVAVHYWTIDDEAAIARLFRAGADGVMTNHPDRGVRARGARR